MDNVDAQGQGTHDLQDPVQEPGDRDPQQEGVQQQDPEDGKGVITMSYIFEEFNPEEFRLLKEMFDLTPEGKDE